MVGLGILGIRLLVLPAIRREPSVGVRPSAAGERTSIPRELRPAFTAGTTRAGIVLGAASCKSPFAGTLPSYFRAPIRAEISASQFTTT